MKILYKDDNEYILLSFNAKEEKLNNEKYTVVVALEKKYLKRKRTEQVSYVVSVPAELYDSLEEGEEKINFLIRKVFELIKSKVKHIV